MLMSFQTCMTFCKTQINIFTWLLVTKPLTFHRMKKKIFVSKILSFHVPEKARFGLTWGWINFHFHFWVNWHFRWKWHASRKWAWILSNRCTMATKLNCTPLNRSRIIHSFILRYNLGESIYVDSPFQFEFCVLNL